MTLNEVAARERLAPLECEHCEDGRAESVVYHFEQDPDFTLRSRVEKLAEEYGRAADEVRPTDHPINRVWLEVARRLREVLEGK